MDAGDCPSGRAGAVSTAPCQEVVITGEDLRRPGGGLASLPVPVSTPGFDAAPYLTATLCITRDPDTGTRNMGTYRAALKATDRLGVRMATRVGGAGGYQHWLKHKERGTPMPCAIVIGCAPVVMFTGPQKLPLNQDEMGVAGGLAGAPIRTVKAVSVELDVPADAEIVIEGLIDPDLLEPEGPFGESHGHVALEDFNMSMQVTAITRERAPVFVSIISQVTPSKSSVIKKVAYEPLFLNHLRNNLSIKGVRAVVMHEPLTNIRKVIFVQFDSATPRTEVWRALHGTATLQAACGKIVIAVSEDIDANNADAVFWSLAYRCNPAEDVHIARYRSGGHGPKSGSDTTNSTMLIDATLKHPLPPVSLPKLRLHGACARAVGSARASAARAAGAVARLFARPLGCGLGQVRPACGHWCVGAERHGDVASRRGGVDPGDAGARCGRPVARYGVKRAGLLRRFVPRNDEAPNRHCGRSEAIQSSRSLAKAPLIVLTQ